MSDDLSRSQGLYDAQAARVEAIGEPGQRRFRLITMVDGETVIVWMEKQQLDALGRALEQILVDLPGVTPIASVTDESIAFDLDTRRQFRVGRMELGFDEQSDRLVVIAHAIEAEEGDVPGLTCRLTRGQARELSDRAAEVVAAGRPQCVLCGQPMSPGPHACPRQNGHLPGELGDTAREDDA